jgi:hypothetical protein
MERQLTRERKNMRRYILCMTAIFFAVTVEAAESVSPTGDGVTTLHFLEKEPSKYLLHQVDRAFAEAASILLKYRPAGEMGRALFDDKRVGENWKYRVDLRCSYRCDGYAGNLRDFLRSGVRVHEPCPAPIDLAIEFLRNDGTSSTFYANSRASCFMLDDKSFVVRESTPDFNFLSDDFLLRSIPRIFASEE